MITFTDLQSQYQDAKQEIDAAIAHCLEKNSFITGPDVDEFEQTMIDYTGAEACASCGSGTTALQIALLACGIGPGDEVITVSHTFVSTPEAVVNCGADPVFVDIDDYYHMDVTKIKLAITPRTKAILFVDLYGQTPDIDRIVALAKTYNLYTIEDAAQSFGYSYKGRRVGSLVDITCVSFNPVKNLGAIGDAGCVLGSKYLVDRAKMYRDHGRKEKFNYEVVGMNCRIDNIQARVVRAKLPFLETWLERKRNIAAYYNRELADYYEVPKCHAWGSHTWYVYVLATDSRRDDVRQQLLDKDIQTNCHYPRPAHTTPAFAQWRRVLPKTEKQAKRIFSVPLYHSLTDAQVNDVVSALKEAA